MPRKRLDLEHGEKVEEIIERASALLGRGGYAELTVNRVAADLGITRAAVYWYFPSRDELFVAAARRVLTDSLAAPPRGGYLKAIEWAVDRLSENYDVYTELQRVASTVPSAAELLDGFQRSLCDGLKVLLRDRVESDRLQPTADTIVMFIEGLLGRRLPPTSCRRQLRFGVKAIMGAERD